LSRRELSEKQLRTRLTRKGYSPDEVDEAIGRLKADRSLDDARVAAAIARTQTSIRRRGRLRVRREIEMAGISGEAAKTAVDSVFADLDEDELLVAALRRRLRDQPIADDREFQRLYRYLVSQGFESDRALKALKAHRSR
jgi:regulatory protein